MWKGSVQGLGLGLRLGYTDCLSMMQTPSYHPVSKHKTSTSWLLRKYIAGWLQYLFKYHAWERRV